MTRYLFLRILGIIAVLLIISMVTFALMHIVPGGPWDAGKWPLSGTARDNMLKLYGLDKPVWQQYVKYLWNALHLDFGTPYTAPEMTVLQVFGRTWPVSLQLAGMAALIFFPIGFGLGIFSALKPNTWIDYLCTFLSTTGLMVPSFVFSFAFIMIFSVALKWLPIMGWNESRMWILGGLVNKTWIMPVIIWGLGMMAPITRYTRMAILDVIQSDYVRTAWAKGLTSKIVFWRHVMRNALIPIIAVVVPMIPGIITGNNWIERIFAIPGIGRYFVDAVLKRDYVLIMAVMLMWCFLVSLFNLISDLLYTLVDPRVRLTGGQQRQ